MVPFAILLGLIGGFIPKARWWVVPVAGLLWSVMLAIGGDPTMTRGQIWVGGFLLGAVNAAVGMLVTWGLSAAVGGLMKHRPEHRSRS